MAFVRQTQGQRAALGDSSALVRVWQPIVPAGPWQALEFRTPSCRARLKERLAAEFD